MLSIDRKDKDRVRVGQHPYIASSLSVVAFAVFVSAAQKHPSPTPADIFRQARPSVVLIVGSASNDTVAQGSGFIVGTDKIVTNYHVIAGLSEAYVLFADGHTEPVAGVIAADAEQDAAILTARTGTRPPLALGDELNLHEGDPVLAIGAPQGLELSLTNGIVSAFRNSHKEFLIQNTAPIAPGSSGGPLLDSRCRVVGLTTSSLENTPGVYFSVGISAVKRLLKAAPTLSQSFAEWTAAKGVTRSPNLTETFKWIKDTIEEKAGGIFPYRPDLGVVLETGEEQKYGLELHQSTDQCVFQFTFKRKIVAHNVDNSLTGDALSGCVKTIEETYSDTLPIYYLKKAELDTKTYGIPTVYLEFDGKKHGMHWVGKSDRTECRDASLNYTSAPRDRQDMIDDFVFIQFHRYPSEDNEDLAKRVADALNHAAAVCASHRPVSKEPF